MKRKLLLFTLAGILSMGTLTSCGDPAPICEQAAIVSITNETDLKAEWHAGQADRMLNYAIDECGPVTINQSALVTSGDVTITSSNADILKVTGRYLSAIAQGTATVTVTYKESSTSIEIEVQRKLGAPDVKIMGIADVFSQEDTKGAYAYLTEGYVSRYYSSNTDMANQGRFYVRADNTGTGAEYLVYNCAVNASALTFSDATASYSLTYMRDFRQNALTCDIDIGTKIRFLAIRADYNATKEVNALILQVNDKPISNGTVTTKEANAIAANNQYLYTVTGKITKWVGDNTDATEDGYFYIQTEGADQEELYIRGASADATALTFNAETNAYRFTSKDDFLTNSATQSLTIGSTVTILGLRSDYQTTKQFAGIILPDPVTKTAPQEKYVNSIKEIIDDTAKDFSVIYNVTGYISALYGSNGDFTDYGNFYITDANGQNAIAVYGCSVAATFTFDEISGFYRTNFGTRDFLTNDATKDAKLKSKITLKVLRDSYGATKQLQGKVISVVADDRT